MMPNKYPIFIISYNRAKNHLTAKHLASWGVKHYMVVHKEQLDDYKKYMTPEMKEYTTFLEFDDSYKLKYETCDNIPHSIKNAGSGAERNFAWDYSIKLGAKAHWLMDDNMGFYYVKGITAANVYVRKSCDKENFWNLFKKGEEFFDRYSNLMMIELAASEMCISKMRVAYALNTRCFSCNLIWNEMPIRWRGRYNEDVILSTDVMVAGYCIASYRGGVLKHKQSTRSAVGGNHATKKGDQNSLYADGFNYKYSSVDKTNLLIKVYPKYYRKVIKYGRVHHEYNRKALATLISPLKLHIAKIPGEKVLNLNDFKKVKHYLIPK